MYVCIVHALSLVHHANVHWQKYLKIDFFDMRQSIVSEKVCYQILFATFHYSGMTGQKCDRCSTSDHYVGDATGNGTCYYPLLISYQYTFTLDSKSDPYITAINFVNVSSTKEEIDFNIQLEVKPSY